jgi:hypothetical protein
VPPAACLKDERKMPFVGVNYFGAPANNLRNTVFGLNPPMSDTTIGLRSDAASDSTLA